MPSLLGLASGRAAAWRRGISLANGETIDAGVLDKDPTVDS